MPQQASKPTHPIDIHVGKRLRRQRMLLGLSQMAVGEALDLTYQQLQKNEMGANRIGASRLYELSLVLGVEPNFFFEGLPAQVEKDVRDRMSAACTMGQRLRPLGGPLKPLNAKEAEAQRMAQAWLALPNEETRRLVGNVMQYFLNAKPRKRRGV